MASTDRIALGLLAGVVALPLCSGASGQVAYFSRTTDTIRLPGATVLGTTATYEARVMFLPNTPPFAIIWNEHLASNEDKAFVGGLTGVLASGWPVGSPTNISVTMPVSAFTWHHLAYVKDVTQERLYLDGALVNSRNVSGTIRNATAGSAVAAVGAIRRTEGILASSFIGFIDTLRISGVARYAANFTPPGGDLSTDADTLLLLNFNEARGATSVSDLSGHGETGTLTPWFAGATLPELCPSPYILTQPLSTSACLGEGASFEVVAVGAGPFTYRWQWQPAGAGTPWIDVTAGFNTDPSGAGCCFETDAADGPMLTESGFGNAGAQSPRWDQRCIISNACGSTTTDPASFAACTGDFNCDGGVDGSDVDAFFIAWVNADPTADVNIDGGVDGADVEYFFARWASGC